MTNALAAAHPRWAECNLCVSVVKLGSWTQIPACLIYPFRNRALVCLYPSEVLPDSGWESSRSLLSLSQTRTRSNNPALGEPSPTIGSLLRTLSAARSRRGISPELLVAEGGDEPPMITAASDEHQAPPDRAGCSGPCSSLSNALNSRQAFISFQRQPGRAAGEGRNQGFFFSAISAAWVVFCLGLSQGPPLLRAGGF